MTDDKKPDQPREWWIHSTGNAYTRDVSSNFPVVHVIEHSAYLALQKRCEELERQIKNGWKDWAMKQQVVQVTEVDGEGLDALLGSRVLLMCAGYFYEGKLIGVNETFVKLDDAAIVYSTGEWNNKSYLDIQKLHQKEWYVQRGLIESFGRSKNE